MKKRTKTMLFFFIAAAGLVLAALLAAGLGFLAKHAKTLSLITVTAVYDFMTDDFRTFADYEADYKTAAAFILRNLEAGVLHLGDTVRFGIDGAAVSRRDASGSVPLTTTQTQREAFARIRSSQEDELSIRINETDFRFFAPEASHVYDILVYSLNGKLPANEKVGWVTYYPARRKTGNWYVLHAKLY